MEFSGRSPWRLVAAAWLSSNCAAHQVSSGSNGTGLIGYGIPMWEPACAYACQRVLALSPLECSEHYDGARDNLQRRHDGHAADFTTSPDCFNHDRAFLLSLAWCLHQQCSEAHSVELWELERFWKTDAVPDAHHAPNYTYSQALELCEGGLKPVVSQGHPLKEPSTLKPDNFEAARTYLADFSRVEAQHSRYGIMLVIIMCLLPLILTLGNFVVAAMSRALERRLLAHVIEPALWGRRHLVSLPYDIGMAPLRGQTILIAFIISLNIGLSTVSYQGTIPNLHYESATGAYLTYLSNRTGYLSFANLVVVFLYSGRNNPLIAISGWQYGTFVLLHRWVGYVCIAQAAAHTLLKINRHKSVLAEQFAKLYWNIGVAAVLVFGIIFITSILPFRRRWYQAFVDIHNILAVLVLVLCFLHVYVEFGYRWGYENWVVLAAVIWAGERFIRLIKLAAHGRHEAVITPLDEDYFEINIEGVSEAGYVYLYFPRRWWRLWENHPFSIANAVSTRATGDHAYTRPAMASTAMFELASDDDSDTESIGSDHGRSNDTSAILESNSQHVHLVNFTTATHNAHSSSTSDTATSDADAGADTDQEKGEDDEGDSPLLPAGYYSAPGLSFLVRRQRGATKALYQATQPQKVLIEGPYRSLSTLSSLSHATAQLVCIVGGSGIAAVMPLLRSRASGTSGRTVLYWGCRSEALILASGVNDLASTIEVNVLMKKRLDVGQIVRQEAQTRSGGIALVTCGPAAMADDVRHAVVGANRRMTGDGLIRLYEECYSW